MVKNSMGFLSRHMVSVAVLLLWVKTVAVSLISFDLTFTSWVDGVLVLLGPVGILMLFVGFSFLFGKRINPYGLLMVLVLTTILLYSNLLYYRFYIDFVTLAVVLQLNSVGGFGSSTVELMSPFDIFLFLDLILFGWLVFENREEERSVTKIFRLKYALSSFGLILLVVAIVFLHNPRTFEATYNREQLVKSIGLYNYQIYNLFLGIKGPMTEALAGPPDVQKVKEYVESKNAEKTDLFGKAQGKNVVLISLESTQNFVFNQKIDGKEITPFLNRLIKNSYYFSNIYDQTSQGKTSDAEFMVDNSLYPLPSGSVFVRRPDNEYHSLPRILKQSADYTVASFHGNDRTFWNREAMYKALGYDHFFSKRDYDVTEANSVNYGIKDIPFYDQSVEKLADLQKPYMAKFITLTNHFPFLLNEEDKLISGDETELDLVSRYANTVHYEDQALKRFFQMLKEEGLYKDSIFVLYGDHYGISQQYEKGVFDLVGMENTPSNHVKLQQVPVMIHMPGQEGKTIETLGGQIDIRPTLLHLLGIPTEGRVSFGQNLFTRDDSPVIFRDGGMVSNDYIYHDALCYDKKTEEQVKRSNCLAYQDTIHKKLNLSDQIILGDLLRFIPMENGT